MDLSECHEIVGIDAERSTESGTVPQDVGAAVATAEP
jgi:hypothetical protein